LRPGSPTANTSSVPSGESAARPSVPDVFTVGGSGTGSSQTAKRSWSISDSS
jgi:hypothetical protein